MKIRILHAEDDMLFAGIVRVILQQDGFEIYNAGDGRDAWLLFNVHPIKKYNDSYRQIQI